MSQTGFPSLEPAFTARLFPGPDFTLGTAGNGEIRSLVPITSGTFKSEPEFGVPLDAEFVFGSDYVRVEPTHQHSRIHVNAILRHKDGALLKYSYKGIIKMNEQVAAIMTRDPNATTTDYGYAFTQVKIESGAEPFKALEHDLFVGSAHFVVEDGKIMVETKISRVRG